MRVSSSQMFESGMLGISRNQADLFKLQNQLSTGRRILSPKDDPVASAQALVITQSKEVNNQYLENLGNAGEQLGLLEGNLAGLTDFLQYVRERAVQLGNTTLNDRDRGFIASELESRFEQLVGLANEQNGTGQYLYSGFQGATQPFAATSNTSGVFSATNPAVNYAGDSGDRLLQVGASRQLGVTVSGADIFMRIQNGNGTFSVTTPPTPPGPTNSGTAIADPGTVLNAALWNDAIVQPQNFEIQFRIDNTGAAPVTYYNLVDATSGLSMYTNAAPSAGPPYVGEWRTFTPGQAIRIDGLDPAFGTASGGTDLGIQIVVSGNPADNDKFIVRQSQNQSLFDTVKNLAVLAGQPIPVSAAGTTEFANNLSAQLSALDLGLENVLRVRADVGTRLSEIDTLKNIGTDLDLQYTSRISNLQDLDFAEAISNLTRYQTQLEAAQKIFVRANGLSLFDVL